MRTLTKTLAMIGLMASGMAIAGCSRDNEAHMTTDPLTGKSTGGGVNPPNVAKNSAEFDKNNRPAMENKENVDKYKAQRQQ